MRRAFAPARPVEGQGRALALLVIPGGGLLLDSWLGLALGAVMYVATRHYRGAEEAYLAATFGDAYWAYRANVLLPWL